MSTRESARRNPPREAASGAELLERPRARRRGARGGALSTAPRRNPTRVVRSTHGLKKSMIRQGPTPATRRREAGCCSGLISHQEASVTILHLSLYETLRKGFEPEIWDASEASA